ncbi:putative retrotransposon nucleocapsid protein [Botrytis fragariae]|uniref:Putative retrotransposon nucleocapsid protein n=1 Tax=Botrytis fragariae TaxID=1964551 RepID=A0A8H6EFX5_9HELO|nr:putative retrotransposon nucleocapsid protein [Botrytis fragariae]KAF5870693.1 putative retrotransposon nucleocapsid protein [Botrytis fragariae]
MNSKSLKISMEISLTPNMIIPLISLIDSRATGYNFIDRKVVSRLHIPTHSLPYTHYLLLANRKPSNILFQYALLDIQINNHKKINNFAAVPVDPKPPLRKLIPKPASIEEITNESFENTLLPPQNQSTILESIKTSNTQRNLNITNFKALLKSNLYYTHYISNKSNTQAKIIPNQSTLKAVLARIITSSRIHRRSPQNQNVLPPLHTLMSPDPPNELFNIL